MHCMLMRISWKGPREMICCCSLCWLPRLLSSAAMPKLPWPWGRDWKRKIQCGILWSLDVRLRALYTCTALNAKHRCTAMEIFFLKKNMPRRRRPPVGRRHSRFSQTVGCLRHINWRHQLGVSYCCVCLLALSITAHWRRSTDGSKSQFFNNRPSVADIFAFALHPFFWFVFAFSHYVASSSATQLYCPWPFVLPSFHVSQIF